MIVVIYYDHLIVRVFFLCAFFLTQGGKIIGGAEECVLKSHYNRVVIGNVEQFTDVGFGAVDDRLEEFATV